MQQKIFAWNIFVLKISDMNAVKFWGYIKKIMLLGIMQRNRSVILYS